jgi:sugar lactone lactonase YvrE
MAEPTVEIWRLGFSSQMAAWLLWADKLEMFIYDVATGKLLASFHNGLTGPENTFLNDVTFAPDGSAYVTDSVNPVLYRMVPSGADTYRLEEYVHWDVQKVGWVRAPGAAGINFNGVVVTPDGKYLILSKRNDSGLYRFEIATKEITKVQLPDGAVFTQDSLFMRRAHRLCCPEYAEVSFNTRFRARLCECGQAQRDQESKFPFPDIGC